MQLEFTNKVINLNVIPFSICNLNRKTRGKHLMCYSCGNLMKRIYVKSQYCKKATMKGIGWICLFCGSISLDQTLKDNLEVYHERWSNSSR